MQCRHHFERAFGQAPKVNAAHIFTSKWLAFNECQIYDEEAAQMRKKGDTKWKRSWSYFAGKHFNLLARNATTGKKQLTTELFCLLPVALFLCTYFVASVRFQLNKSTFAFAFQKWLDSGAAAAAVVVDRAYVWRRQAPKTKKETKNTQHKE